MFGLKEIAATAAEGSGCGVLMWVIAESVGMCGYFGPVLKRSKLFHALGVAKGVKGVVAATQRWSHHGDHTGARSRPDEGLPKDLWTFKKLIY